MAWLVIIMINRKHEPGRFLLRQFPPKREIFQTMPGLTPAGDCNSHDLISVHEQYATSKNFF